MGSRARGSIMRASLVEIVNREKDRPLALNTTPSVRSMRILSIALLLVLLIPASSWAHGFAGKRFFPTTFQVDDPFISDEFSILINRIKGTRRKVHGN